MKILFFSPFSGVLPHVRFEVRLADGLQSIGHEVLAVNCDGLYREYCITMSAHGLREDSDPALKLAECRNCKRVRGLNARFATYSTLDVDPEFSSDDARTVSDLMDSVTSGNWIDFQYRGLAVGRIAAYEFLLNYKKNSPTLSAEEFKAYRMALRNSLATLIAMDRVLERHQPDRVLIFDSAYSVNGIVKALSEKRGIPVYDFRSSMNLSNQYGQMCLFKGDVFKNFGQLKSATWAMVKDIPLDYAQVTRVTDHFRTLFQGTNVFVYSAPRTGQTADLRTHFGIAPHQKVIVAALSSYDERFAAHFLGRAPSGTEALFSSQEDWCRALFDWVKDHPEYFLIVRVHPREFPNKRESVKSVHVERLKACFETRPSNTAINWPTDNISIYNLAEVTDLFLSAWSSVGTEMSLFGLPVVIYSDDLVLYPSDLNLLGETKPEYFARIEEGLAAGWSFERIRKTYRWLSVLYSRSTVDLVEKRSKLRNFLARCLTFLGHRTKIQGFHRAAGLLYIAKLRFSPQGLRKIDDVLTRRLNSLAEAEFSPPSDPVTPDQEAEFIRVQMENLFQGVPSKIITNLRTRFSGT